MPQILNGRVGVAPGTYTIALNGPGFAYGHDSMGVSSYDLDYGPNALVPGTIMHVGYSAPDGAGTLPLNGLRGITDVFRLDIFAGALGLAAVAAFTIGLLVRR